MLRPSAASIPGRLGFALQGSSGSKVTNANVHCFVMVAAPVAHAALVCAIAVRAGITAALDTISAEVTTAIDTEVAMWFVKAPLMQFALCHLPSAPNLTLPLSHTPGTVSSKIVHAQ